MTNQDEEQGKEEQFRAWEEEHLDSQGATAIADLEAQEANQDEGLLTPTEIGDNLDLEVEGTYPCSDGSTTMTISVDKLLKAQRDLTYPIAKEEGKQEGRKEVGNKMGRDIYPHWNSPQVVQRIVKQYIEALKRGEIK